MIPTLPLRVASFNEEKPMHVRFLAMSAEAVPPCYNHAVICRAFVVLDTDYRTIAFQTDDAVEARTHALQRADRVRGR